MDNDYLIKKTCVIDNNITNKIKINNIILLDTPGHFSFSNLRTLAIKMSDVVILLIDILNGVLPITIDIIKTLLNFNIPFIIALNKIDKLYGWDNNNSLPIQEIILNQDLNTQSEFNTRFNQIQTQIMEQGLNCELFWKNNSPEDTINIVPVSAISGQGIPDLLYSIINYSQTNLKQQITWKSDLECIVMEITYLEGYGYTIDCIIKNGQLSKGDVIKIQTQNGFLITEIKNLLSIPNNKDSKYTKQYINHDFIKGSYGIKIIAKKLDKVITGTNIILSNKNELEEYEKLENKLSLENKFSEIESKLNLIELDPKGIAVYSSSYGSLEALVQFLRNNNESPYPIQISQINIGNVIKKDLLKLLLNNKDNNISEQLSVLVFEVKVDEEAEVFAKENKINIFKNDTIYRLFNQYNDFIIKMFEERKENARKDTVFPCILKIIENNVYNKKNPLIMGVEILEGSLHLGTSLILIPSKTYIGKVIGIQNNKKDIKIGKQGQTVCVKIDNDINPNIAYGRHFSHTDMLYSNLTRKSVDILKQFFKNDLSKDDINLLIKLKKIIEY